MFGLSVFRFTVYPHAAEWERTHDRGTIDQALPKGVRAVEGTVEHASTVWELDDTEAVFALLAGNVDTEGLELVTIDEAKT